MKMAYRRYLVTFALMACVTLLLVACAAVELAKTPKDRYYAVNAVYVALLTDIKLYGDACKPKPATDPCYQHMAKMKPLVAHADELFTQADKVFITGDSAFYDLSLSITGNIIRDLRAMAGILGIPLLHTSKENPV